ncbi:amidohydrolase [Salinicola rhizosphaerae]|uniref:Carbon-nitrogen hydrolase n=1 Tax=Salinicola rhizosphaerae TaxID=1443141 RepID=A0ABQ3DP10_9GAMM|nr:amidohydrolase [Salinicola rhizosphaerae]GHB08714.1 carbon-nitrogen hydrolase [Salinicola rhizosphaerae]
MGELRVSVVQTDLVWENAAANRRALHAAMAALDGSLTDLIVLPEMFATGFSMQSETLAEPAQDSPSIQWLIEQARERDCAITGSLAIADHGSCYNRLIWVTPTGDVSYYDKRHLFRMGAEPDHYTGGGSRAVVQINGFRILLSVCYDLRFPVWLRQQPSEGEAFEYDALLCVANWPAARRHSWRTLLQARAVENLSYVIGVNRIGEDGNGLTYAGDSMVIDFKGEPIVDRPQGEAFVETATLSSEALAAFRDKFPAWRDADRFTLALD